MSFSLGTCNGQTQLMAPHSKKVPKAIRERASVWMEEDPND